MNKVDVLVIGGSGFIGAHLVRAAARAGYSAAYTFDKNRPHLPGNPYRVALDQGNSLEACIETTRPGIILYCAKPALASPRSVHDQVNVEGVQRVLAAIDDAPHLLFVYLSTSAVFSGHAGPYAEYDPPDPEARELYSAYALTKRQGELAVLGARSNALVARLARVNGRDIQGSLNRRVAEPLEILRAGQPLPRYSDRYISPIGVDNLVQALLEVIAPGFSYRGILHLAGRQRVTDYYYWRHIVRHLRIDEALVVQDFLSRSISNKMGADNSLETSWTQKRLNTRLLSIDEQIESMFPAREGCHGQRDHL